jgi:cyclopropane-fatty-acyl-phospholipid synthase
MTSILRSVCERVLAASDVRMAVSGAARPWDIRVHDERVFRRVLLEGAVGLGDSYMEGWWDCDDLEEMIVRMIRGGAERASLIMPGRLALAAVAAAVNRQTRGMSRKQARHYDLDNDLFCGFLGKYKAYSCAYFKGTEDLDVAQSLKLEMICRKLDLRSGDRVLDVGGGWGELARYMAETRRCHVTSINISDEQLRYARDLCKGLPVEVVKRDYRDVQGTYDKIAVIAVVSQFGHKNYRFFMEKMYGSLAPDGLMLVDTVGSNAATTHGNPWIDKHVFPGIVFPSIAQLASAAEGLFMIEDVHGIGPSYAKTLRAWNANLQRAWPTLKGRHPESTRRMFEFFFLTVAGYFRARDMQDWHIVLGRQGAQQPPDHRSFGDQPAKNEAARVASSWGASS